MIPFAVLVAGLCLLGFGCYLALKNKGHQVWAAYLFGFCLVLTVGPLGGSIRELSLSPKGGLKVTLGDNNLKPKEAEAVAAQSRQAIAQLAVAEHTAQPGSSQNVVTQTNGTQRDYIHYFESLGYVPTPIVGTNIFRPGNILQYADGRALLWASSKQAYAKLDFVSAPVTLPQFSLSETAANEAAGTKVRLDTSFKCDHSTMESASTTSLQSGITSSLLSAVPAAKELWIVQEAIVCQDLALETQKSSLDRNNNGTEAFLYKSSTPVVLAYRVLRLTVTAGT